MIGGLVESGRLSTKLGVLNVSQMLLFWLEIRIKGSKYLQQAKYSDNKHEINTNIHYNQACTEIE